jgi:hypothetical protein
MYKQRIAFLEDSLRLVDERIERVKGTKDTSSLLDEKAKYQKELSNMRKLQWEHDHETVDLDRDDY